MENNSLADENGNLSPDSVAYVQAVMEIYGEFERRKVEGKEESKAV